MDKNYSNLLINGVPKCGTFISGGDVIIGKTISVKNRPSVHIKLGYASKLMRQELMANGIHVSLKVDKDSKIE
jgi:DNA-directed RNA polymerase beta subunit